MKRSLIISAVGHAAILLWCLVSFAAKPYEGGPLDSLPVDIISSSEFSQITLGSRNAPKPEKPKPLAEKIAEPTLPPEDPTLKVTEKQEVKTTSAEAQPPTPPKPEARKEAREQKQPEQKSEPVAEALKKEAKKPPEKKAESKPTPPPKPAKELPKFDPVRTAALLLDKRDPQRNATAGEIVNTTPSLGLPRANAVALSQSEIDALRAQIEACFSMPAAAADAKNLIVQVRITLNQDGSLSSTPVVTNSGSGLFQIVAESLTRAVRRCAPYKLPIAKYDAWKDVDVSFDPRDMRG
jgi:outer membrane biosynthesis protein TonB